MRPHVVADVGNTRIKWGRCSPDAVIEMASLPPDDAEAWERQRVQWGMVPGSLWVIAGVHPPRRDALADWLFQRGQQVRVVTHPRELPLWTLLPEPEKAGIDRLLDAVAANRRRTPGRAAAIIDAGSAVTVDYLYENGAFAGGAILPGFRLMAKALHDYTALLPVVDPPEDIPPLPGSATIPAIEAGIFWAVVGGVQGIIRNFLFVDSGDWTRPLDVFLTGGDAALLRRMFPKAILWPQMTLEGLRWTAETLT